MKTLGYIAKKYLLLFLAMLCTALPAQATNFDTGPSISAKAEYPAMPAGLPKEEFKIILKIHNPYKVERGSITFETVQANHGDNKGIVIENIHFRNNSENFSLQITPRIKKEGYYYMKALLKIGNQTPSYNIKFLFMDGKVFYAWEGANLLSAIAEQRLENHREYQEIKAKGVARRKEFISKHGAENIFPEPSTNFLTKDERKAYLEILEKERESVLEEVNMKTAPSHTLKKKAPQPVP